MFGVRRVLNAFVSQQMHRQVQAGRMGHIGQYGRELLRKKGSLEIPMSDVLFLSKKRKCMGFYMSVSLLNIFKGILLCW